MSSKHRGGQKNGDHDRYSSSKRQRTGYEIDNHDRLGKDKNKCETRDRLFKDPKLEKYSVLGEGSRNTEHFYLDKNRNIHRQHESENKKLTSSPLKVELAKPPPAKVSRLDVSQIPLPGECPIAPPISVPEDSQKASAEPPLQVPPPPVCRDESAESMVSICDVSDIPLPPAREETTNDSTATVVTYPNNSIAMHTSPINQKPVVDGSSRAAEVATVPTPAVHLPGPPAAPASKQQPVNSPDNKKQIRKAPRLSQADQRLEAELIEQLKTSRKVDEFEPMGRLGEGGYGEVFKARDKATGEMVAMKKFKIKSDTMWFHRTTIRDIVNMRKAGEHENIVAFKELLTSTTGRSIYMTMDLEGRDLRKTLQNLRRKQMCLGMDMVKKYVYQTLDAVKHMHSLNIIHRDLKSANLLISYDRQTIKITDFGLSRDFSTNTSSTLSPVAFTVSYRPPEILLNVKEYRPNVDVWAIGCIMAEMIINKQLFEAKTVIELLKEQFQRMGSPNEESWPGISEISDWKYITFDVYHPGTLHQRIASARSKPLSSNAFDLLTRLLTLNPNLRANASSALRHEWFLEKDN